MKIVDIEITNNNVGCLIAQSECVVARYCANHIINTDNAHSLYGARPKIKKFDVVQKKMQCVSDEVTGGDHIFGIALTLNTIPRQLEFDFQ